MIGLTLASQAVIARFGTEKLSTKRPFEEELIADVSTLRGGAAMQILKGDLSNIKGIPPSGLCVGVQRAGAVHQKMVAKYGAARGEKAWEKGLTLVERIPCSPEPSFLNATGNDDPRFSHSKWPPAATRLYRRDLRHGSGKDSFRQKILERKDGQRGVDVGDDEGGSRRTVGMRRTNFGRRNRRTARVTA
jgi:hypothetical protein